MTYGGPGIHPPHPAINPPGGGFKTGKGVWVGEIVNPDPTPGDELAPFLPWIGRNGASVASDQPGDNPDGTGLVTIVTSTDDATTIVGAPGIPVVAGDVVRLGAWVRVPTAQNARVGFAAYEGATWRVGNYPANQIIPANTWTWLVHEWTVENGTGVVDNLDPRVRLDDTLTGATYEVGDAWCTVNAAGPLSPPVYTIPDPNYPDAGHWSAGDTFWSGVLGTEGVTFLVEVASQVGTGGTDFVYDDAGSLWDEAVYSTGDLTWFDITTAVESFSVRRGRDALADEFRPGIASLTLSNDTGWANPLRGFSVIGDQALRPGRWVRFSGKLTTDPDAPWVPLWLGRIDSLGDEYRDAAHRILSRWNCMDLLSTLESIRDPELENPDPATAGQRTDERVRYIWDTIIGANPDWLLTPEQGLHTMPATTLPGSRLEQMQSAAQAEGGDLYADKTGAVVFRNQTWLDDGPTPEGEIQFAIGTTGDSRGVLDAQTSWDSVRVVNAVTVTRAPQDGEATPPIPQSVQNPSSVALYGRRSRTVSGVEVETDVQASNLANLLIDRHAWDTLRLDEIKIWAAYLEDAQALLDVELGWRVLVRIATAQNWDYTIVAWVNGITHEVSEDDWVITLRLDNTDRSNPLLGGAFDGGAFSEAFNRKEEL